MVLDSSTDKALDRAMVRVRARDVSAALLKVTAAGYDATEFYEVASTNRPGLMHRVALSFTSAGIESACDCEAGVNHRLCCHVAAALEASTALSEPEPEPSPVAHLGLANLQKFMTEGALS